MSVAQRIFLGLAAFLLAANVLIMNDLSTLWDGAEALLAWQSGRGEAGPALPGILLAQTWPQGVFWFRLPGALLLLLAFPLYWWMAKALLGREATIYTLLVLAASLMVPNLAKLASGDIWAMVTQWLGFAVLLRFLKQPLMLWRLVFYSLLALAIWIQPVNASIFLLGSSAYLYFAHPQGKNLLSLQPWLAGVAIAAVLYWGKLLPMDNSHFVIGFQSGRFLLWSFLGMAPFIGFCLAGLWGSIQRARQGEELAVINLGALAFALLGHSLALPGILAFLTAKQIQGYFKPGYPYKAIVQAGALLHLLAIFFASFLLLTGSFIKFDAAGYRASVAVTGLYWMLSFIGVLGLVGMNRRHTLAGTFLAGLLLTTLFWLQLNPFLEKQRSWPFGLLQEAERLMPALKSVDDGLACAIYIPPGTPFPSLAAYAQAVFPTTILLDSEAALRQVMESQPENCFLLPAEIAEVLAPGQADLRAEGWDGRLRFVAYELLCGQKELRNTK
jgi:hypothetical protein